MKARMQSILRENNLIAFPKVPMNWVVSFLTDKTLLILLKKRERKHIPQTLSLREVKYLQVKTPIH